MIFVPLFVFLLWVESGDEFVNEVPVEYVHEEQAFVPTKDISDKMIVTPDITSIFAMLVVRSIAMLHYLSLAISCLPFCHVSPNNPFLANRCLAKLPLLLSPSYSVASCR